MNIAKALSILIFSSLLLLFACKKDALDSIVKQEKYGKVAFKFLHYVNGKPLIKDSLMYNNAFQKLYSVYGLKYFLSEFSLWKSGVEIKIDSSAIIHYIDLDITSTQTWNLLDKIPEGAYDSVTFMYGISAQNNKSNIFVNPPESNLFWPASMGGGYHYMQLDLKWKDSLNLIQSFNCHLGIGKSGNAFVHNCFRVNLSNSDFTLAENENKTIPIIMNIDSWFHTPYAINFSLYTAGIMGNQNAMNIISQNGFDVFTLGTIN